MMSKGIMRSASGIPRISSNWACSWSDVHDINPLMIMVVTPTALKRTKTLESWSRSRWSGVARCRDSSLCIGPIIKSGLFRTMENVGIFDGFGQAFNVPCVATNARCKDGSCRLGVLTRQATETDVAHMAAWETKTKGGQSSGCRAVSPKSPTGNLRTRRDRLSHPRALAGC